MDINNGVLNVMATVDIHEEAPTFAPIASGLPDLDDKTYVNVKDTVIHSVGQADSSLDATATVFGANSATYATSGVQPSSPRKRKRGRRLSSGTKKLKPPRHEYVIGTRGASFSNSGGVDATYTSFGGDGAYRAAGNEFRGRTTQPPPSAPVGPTLPPVTAPSSVVIPFQLEYGFDVIRLTPPRQPGVRKLQDSSRQPTPEEFEGLLVQTQRFYADLLRESFANLISVEVVQVGDDYRPGEALPVLVEIEITGIFAATDGTIPPTPQDLSSVMTNADYDGKFAGCTQN